jgi:predicted Zn-dependent peptidase
MNPIQKTLNNGVRVVIVPNDAPTVTALVMVGTGSAYDGDHERGLSHFLEHMVFKGTTKRPDAKYISEELESIGAVSNAFTDLEFTGYYAKGNPGPLETFLDVLSDVYLNGTFPPIEIEKEKGVIIEEINMYEDRPDIKVHETFFEAMFGDSGMGRATIGTKESVRSFNREDFFAYKDKHYVGANTIVVVAGKCEPGQVHALVETYFSSISEKEKLLREPTHYAEHTEASVAVLPKQTDQTHIVIGCRAFAATDPRTPALSLLATILGRGMSSRLFIKLREELGVAYYVGAGTESFVDAGLFSISAGIDKARIIEVCGAIADELALIKNELVSEKELKKAKEFTASLIRLGLESTDAIAEYYAIQLVRTGVLKTPNERIADLMDVTVEDIRTVAQEVFKKEGITIAVVGSDATPESLSAPFEKQDSLI